VVAPYECDSAVSCIYSESISRFTKSFQVLPKSTIGSERRLLSLEAIPQVRACLGPGFFLPGLSRLRLSKTWFPTKPTPTGFGIESQYVTTIRLGLDSFQLDAFASFTVVSTQLWYGYVQKSFINVVQSYQQWRPTKKASYKVPSSQQQLLPSYL